MQRQRPTMRTLLERLGFTEVEGTVSSPVQFAVTLAGALTVAVVVATWL